MTVMEQLAESDELDMLVLITSLTSETGVSLDAQRVRAVAARCGKPMTVWTYTLPSGFGREQAARCSLFVHSELRNVGVAMARLAGYAGALGRPLSASHDGTAAAPLPADLPCVVTEHQAKALLAPFGIPESRELLTSSAVAVADAAGALVFPVALRSRRWTCHTRPRLAASSSAWRPRRPLPPHMSGSLTQQDATCRTQASTAFWYRRWHRKATSW